MGTRRGAKHWTRVALSVVLGLVVAEGVLQAVAWTNRALRDRADFATDASQTAAGSSRTWVCIGDSNTFGVFEDPGDAYPAVLERLVRDHASGAPPRVVNLGMPAINGRQALGILEGALDEYEPELALVLVGANNAWSWHSASEFAVLEPPWYESLRLVRLARLARFAWSSAGRAADELPRFAAGEGGGRVVTGRDRSGRRVVYGADETDRRASGDELHASVRRDLRRMAERLGDEACRLVFLTYAFDEGGLVGINEAIRCGAEEAGSLLIDCSAELEPARARFPAEHLFHADGHPRAAGYELFARSVYRGLREAGLLEGVELTLFDPEDDIGTPAPPPATSFPLGAVLPVVTIESGDPGRPFALVLSGAADGEPAVLDGTTLPVLDDETYRSTLLDVRLLGTTDDAGRARVDLGSLVVDPRALHGRAFRLAYVLYQGRERPRVRRVSSAVEFTAR